MSVKLQLKKKRPLCWHLIILRIKIKVLVQGPSREICLICHPPFPWHSFHIRCSNHTKLFHTPTCSTCLYIAQYLLRCWSIAQHSCPPPANYHSSRLSPRAFLLANVPEPPASRRYPALPPHDTSCSEAEVSFTRIFLLTEFPRAGTKTFLHTSSIYLTHTWCSVNASGWADGCDGYPIILVFLFSDHFLPPESEPSVAVPLKVTY